MLSKPVDGTSQWMADNGVPLTREEYIELMFFGDKPDRWDAEYEMMLPEQLQDWSLFKLIDGEMVYQG